MDNRTIRELLQQEGSFSDPTFAEVGVFHSIPQQQYNPYFSSYNPGWRDQIYQSSLDYSTFHPRQNWQQNSDYHISPFQQHPAPPLAQPQSGPSLEELIKQMATNNLQFQQITDVNLQSLQTQIGQLTNAINQNQPQAPNNLPSQSNSNLNANGKNVSDITLGSSKQMVEPTAQPEKTITMEVVAKEKELQEQDLKEQDMEERVTDKQEKETCDDLIVYTNPSFVYVDSLLIGDVGVSPKEEIQDNNFLCEDVYVEKKEPKAHGEAVCDPPPYKNPHVLVPSGELSIKFPWSKHCGKSEASRKSEQPLGKISLSFDTLYNCNMNNTKCFTLDSYGIKAWTIIEFADLNLLVVPNDFCSHDVTYSYRSLEKLTMESQVQASTLIGEPMSKHIINGVENNHATLKHFNSLLSLLNCVIDVRVHYSMFFDLTVSETCELFNLDAKIKMNKWRIMIMAFNLFLPPPCTNYSTKTYLHPESFALIKNDLHIIVDDFVIFDPGGYLFLVVGTKDRFMVNGQR